MININKLLTEALQKNQLTLTHEQQQKLLQYLQLITSWNRVFNLTNITSPSEMVYLHIIDSLLVAPFLQGQRFLDVGSGAGLPGIPLAILNPNQQWTLLDKNSKKTRFMTQAVADLGLANVNVVHSRSEEFHPANCFDSILSRAFGSIEMFTDTTTHLLCDNGTFLAMKGKYPQEELDTLSDRYIVESVSELKLNGMDVERHIVCLRKNIRG